MMLLLFYLVFYHLCDNISSMYINSYQCSYYVTYQLRESTTNQLCQFIQILLRERERYSVHVDVHVHVKQESKRYNTCRRREGKGEGEKGVRRERG